MASNSAFPQPTGPSPQSIAQGGTGTTTAFTQGSVLFAGVAGVYTADASFFTYNVTSHQLTLGGQLNLNGSIVQNSAYAKFGNTSPFLPVTTGVDIFGNDNTTAGVQAGVGNRSNGTSAYSGFYLNNDLSSDLLVDHYFFMGLNSSGYNDPTFGTAFAVANQVNFQNTDGPIAYVTNKSGATGAQIWYAGGAALANQIMTLTSTGVRIGLGTPINKFHTSFDGTIPSSQLYNAATDGTLVTGNAQIGNRVVSASGASGTALTQTNSAFAAIEGTRGTIASPVAVASADVLGFQNFLGYDGTTRQNSVRLVATVDTTVSSGIIPGRFGIFTADTSGNLQEGFRVDSSQIATALGDLKIATVGKGLYVKEGTNATMGTGTLVGGTLVVSTTKVTANSRIFITDTGGGVLANIGALYVSAKSAGTSFTVSSSNALDTSTFNWIIVEPA